jgi:hypothetical protein
MPRKPYPVKKARALLENWLELRVAKASDEAPITAAAAAVFLESRGIKTHRTTLYSKGLNGIIVDAARRQGAGAGSDRRSEQRREHDAIVAAMREDNTLLEKRNRALLGEIATMVFNARRCNVSEDELRRPMTPPDRSRSRAGTKSSRTRRA